MSVTIDSPFSLAVPCPASATPPNQYKLVSSGVPGAAANVPAFLPACLTASLPASMPACLPTSLPAFLPACLPASLPASLPAC